MSLDRLDDPNFPAYTIGQAAELLGCAQAFLRRLDGVGLVEPLRSEGHHRRYSRAQLEVASRVRVLLDDGFPMSAACRVVVLEDELRKAKSALSRERAARKAAEARTEPGATSEPDGPGGTPRS
ncbi:MAG: helix-turn-helix domain-containing protein [Actinomycetes bacterium]